MNQHNLISIVPTIPSTEMTTDVKIKNQKRKNLIEKISKLKTRLSRMHPLSNENRWKLNQDYQGHLQQIEDSIKSSKMSLKTLLKIDETLDDIERRIRTSSIFNNSHDVIIDSTPIDLTNEDEVLIVKHNLPPISRDSPRTTDQTKENESIQQNGGHTVPFSSEHRTDRMKKIVDIDALYENLTQNSKYVSDPPTTLTDDEVPEENIDNTPALRILEMAKQNTGASCSPSILNSAPSVQPTVSADQDFKERVTNVIRSLPEEDKMVLKGGVDKVQELVEKKTKPLAVQPEDIDEARSTSKMVQLRSTQCLSSYLMGHLQPSSAVLSESTASDEVSESFTASKPELPENSLTCKTVEAKSSLSFSKPGICDSKNVRPNESIPKQPVLKPAGRGHLDGQLVKKIIPKPDLDLRKKPLLSQISKNTSVVVPDKKVLPFRSAPLPIPNLIEPRKSNLKTKFSQDIGVVHKVGEGYKKPPSLKQLKNGRQVSTESSSTNSAVKPQLNLVPSSLPKDTCTRNIQNQNLVDTKSSSSRSRILNDAKSLPGQIGSSSSKNSRPRKPPLSAPFKKNSVPTTSQPRRQSLENSSKSNANALESNNLTNSKLTTNFQSPLSGIYDNRTPTARTGLGYGAQNKFKNTYRIPRLNKSDKSEGNKPLLNQNALKDDIPCSDQRLVSDVQSMQKTVDGEVEIGKNKNKKITVDVPSQSISQPRQKFVKTSSSITIDEMIDGGKPPVDEDGCLNYSSEKIEGEKLRDNVNHNSRVEDTEPDVTPVVDCGKMERILSEECKKKISQSVDIKSTADLTINLPAKDDTLKGKEASEECTIKSSKNDEHAIRPLTILLTKVDEKYVCGGAKTCEDSSATLVDSTQEKFKTRKKNSVDFKKLVKYKQSKVGELSASTSSIDARDFQSAINDVKRCKKRGKKKKFKSRKYVDLSDSSDEVKHDDDDDVVGRLSRKGKERQHSKSTKLVTSSEGSNAEISSEVEKKKNERRVRLASTSDDSDTEIQSVLQPVKSKRKLESSDEENYAPLHTHTPEASERNTTSIPSSPSSTVPEMEQQLFNQCTCAYDYMKILQDCNDEEIPTTPLPPIPIHQEDETSDLSVSNRREEDPMENHLCQLPVSDHVAGAINNDDTGGESEGHSISESLGANQEADLLDFLKSSSELQDIQNILDEVNRKEPNWCMHLIRRLKPHQLEIVQRLINCFYSGPNEAVNENTKTESGESTRACTLDSSSDKLQNAAAGNEDYQVGPGELAQAHMKPRKKKHSRELDRLHEDIKKMKKTKKNNIFDAIGERKCRQQYKSYQDRRIKPQDLSKPMVSNSSAGELEVQSDDDSLPIEKRSSEEPSISAEQNFDRLLSSFPLSAARRSVQPVSRRRGLRRRGRPPLRTIQSQRDRETTEPDPEIFVTSENDLKTAKIDDEIELSKVVGEAQASITTSELNSRDLNKPSQAEEETKIVKLVPSENEAGSFETVDEGVGCSKEQSSSNLKATIKKKKKKKNRKKEAEENEHLKNVLKEDERTASALNIPETEGRRSSAHNVPLFQPENIFHQEGKDWQEELVHQKIASLPKRNAFRGADVECAQISSIAVELQDSKLLYKCVSPECSYSVSNAELFANHVTSAHKDLRWNGDCPMCFETVTMYNQADLIDALSHLMKEHLIMTNVELMTVILSDDEENTSTPVEKEIQQENLTCEPTNASDGDDDVIPIDDEVEINTQNTRDHSVEERASSPLPNAGNRSENETSSETSTPRLRVRRLSGDILSGSNPSITPTSGAIVRSISSPGDGFGESRLSLVIKDVKTLQEEDSPASSPCTILNENSSTLTDLHFEEKSVPKMLEKSAQSETSIVKLYKCGGTHSWVSPETCKFSSDKPDDFLLHIYRGHMSTNNKKEKRVVKKFLKCTYCSEQNADAQKLVEHIDSVHGICLFQCAFCEYRAARPVHLDWHRNTAHQNCEKKILVTELKDNKDEVMKRSQCRQWTKPYQEIVHPFTCTSGCTYSTYSETEFIEHSRANHGGVQTWDCSRCDHKCFDLMKLMMHYKVHSMARYQCQYCLFGGPTIAAMQIHLAKLHSHLYPVVLERRLVSSSGKVVKNPWNTRVDKIDLDQPLSNFESYLKVVSVNARRTSACDGEPSGVDGTSRSTGATLPMSIAEETAAAVSAITPNENECPAVSFLQNEHRRASSSGPVSRCSSEGDISDRLIINEDESDDSNSTIAVRLRRRTSAETQPHIMLRSRMSKDYVRGLTGNSLFKCGVAGCTISVDDYKAYGEHLRVCDNARNSNAFQCPHCDYRVQTTKKFLNHLTLHGPARYLCTLCEFKHQQSKHVVEHMKSSIHKVVGEPRIIPVNPLKNDKHNDFFIVKLEPDKIVRNKSTRTSAEMRSMPFLQPPTATESSPPAERITQTTTTTVNSLEDVEKHLHSQLYREFIHCGICNYKNKVRSNLLNHMKEHAAGGLPISENIVNPVPRIGKDETDLMFHKMSNHAGFTAKNDKTLDPKMKDEVTNNSDGLIIPQFVPKMRRYACSAPDCRYFSQDACGLKNHYTNLHNDINQFRCPHCQINVSPLKIPVHLRYHAEKLYKCSICRDYVHFQRCGIEKHQKEKHTNSSYDIEIIREVESTDSDCMGSEGLSDSDTAVSEKGAKRYWKCNLCGDRFGSEPLVKMHCHRRHSIFDKYKCSLCNFSDSVKKNMDEHNLKTNHDSSSEILLVIYEEEEQITKTSGPADDQKKLTAPAIGTFGITQKSVNPFDATDASRGDSSLHSTLLSSSSVDLAEPNRIERNSRTALHPNLTANVKESNEMIVEPYPDQSLKCPFCETFKTKDVKAMRYHLFKEKKCDRYYCEECGKGGVSRADLQSHIIEEINTHPPRNQSYIVKLPADTILEQKVKDALLYQYRKMESNSTEDLLPCLDSNDEDFNSTNTTSPAGEKNVSRTRGREIVIRNSPVFYCDLCDKVYASRRGLSRHMNIHKSKSTCSPSPTKRATELLSTNDSTTLTRRLSFPGRNPLNSNLIMECEQSNTVPDNVSELREQESIEGQQYSCLRCDKSFADERRLTDHVQTSYRLQHSNQPNFECEKSSTKRVILQCPLQGCSYSLGSALYQNYEHIIKHMKVVHPKHTENIVLAQIDDLEPRPLVAAEITLLQAKNLPSAESAPRLARKRPYNTARKSTARPTFDTIEPPYKHLILDVTIPHEQALTPTVSATAGISGSCVVTNTSVQNGEDVAATPMIEVIDLSDDAAEQIDENIH